MDLQPVNGIGIVAGPSLWRIVEHTRGQSGNRRLRRIQTVLPGILMSASHTVHIHREYTDGRLHPDGLPVEVQNSIR